MRYRRKTEYVEAVVFDGQHIPGLALSEVYRDTWEFNPPDGGQAGTARRGDYVFLRDGKPVGSAAPRFFETYYEPAQDDDAEAALARAQGEAAQLRRALEPLAAPADEWHGWWLDEWGDRPTGQTWRCFFCHAEGEEVNSSPPAHKDDCPIVAARRLLADAGAAGGDGDN